MKIAGVLIGSLLLFLFAVTVMRLMPASRPAASSEKVQKFHFPDGAELEVMGPSLGMQMVEIRPTNKRWPWFLNKNSYGETGYQNYSIKVEKINGMPFRVTTRTPRNPNAFLIGIRLRERGVYQPSRAALSGTSPTGEYSIWYPVKATAPAVSSVRFKLADDLPETICKEMIRVKLDMLMQYRDSRGTWVVLTGPYPNEDVWKERSFFMLPAVERDKSILHFRVIRANGQMIEFDLPNPAIRKPSSSITPMALPYTHKGAGYDLTIKQVDRQTVSGCYPFSEVIVKTETSEKSISCVLLDVEDEWGNTMDAANGGKGGSLGVSLPASSQRMKANFLVQRRTGFPRFDYTGYPLAEGIVSADGSHVEFSILPEGKRFGCSPIPSVPLTAYAAKGKAKTEFKDWVSMKLELAVKVHSSAELESIEKRLGDITGWEYLLFPEGSNQSTGFFQSPYGGGGGGNEYRSANYWLLPPEMVQPGKRIRIGVHAPMPDEFFTVDLPTH